MPLPFRYSYKSSRTKDVDRLIESRLIGIHISPDFVYDPQERAGRHTVDPEDQDKKIRNYAVIAPCGDLGYKQFFHGRELLARDQAEAFFVQGRPVEQIIFSPEVLEKVAGLFRPESFSARANCYSLRKAQDQQAIIEQCMEFCRYEFPHIDFSILSSIRQTDLAEWGPAFMDLMEKNGINIFAELQKRQKDPKIPDYMKPLIEKDALADLDKYLAEEKPPGHEALVRRLEADLRSYMREHGYDWEILDNFKTGLSQADEQASLEQILESGIKKRATETLRQAVLQMDNPYSEQFSVIERGMARTITDTLPLRTLDIMLQDKNPVLFFDDNNLNHATHIVGVQLDDTLGKYHPSMPESSYFSNFLLVSDSRLSQGALMWKLRHECEHKLDFMGKEFFAAKYDNVMPALIEKDKANLAAQKEFIASISAASSSDDIKRFMVLARKRGVRCAPEEINTVVRGMLYDIDGMKSRLAVFMDGVGDEKTENLYRQQSNKYAEVPAVMEELKGAVGRNFIKELLPGLSRITEEHRKEVYDLKEQSARG